jgi:hypothetical protein
VEEEVDQDARRYLALLDAARQAGLSWVSVEIEAAVAEGIVETRQVRERDLPRIIDDLPAERSSVPPVLVDRRQLSSHERLDLAIDAIHRAVIDPMRMEREIRSDLGADASIAFVEDIPGAPPTLLLSPPGRLREPIVDRLESALSQLRPDRDG